MSTKLLFYPSMASSSSSSSSSQLVAALFLLTALSLISPSKSATCASQAAFTGHKLYAFCADLSALNAYLHWSYDQSQSTLSLAFVAAPTRPDGWISWSINPTGTGMVGAQALLAFRDSSGAMTVKTYNVSVYGPLTESRVWYDVKESSAEYSGGVMRLFATLVLPEKGRTTVNHVWQVGSSVTGGVPDKHEFQAGNLNAKGSLDLLRGQSNGGAAGGGDSKINKRNIHGILNVVSWGIMFPIGIVMARYLRTFPSLDPTWFYLHVSCQVSAYVIGVAGWATGLKLGSESKGITYSYHRNIGITLFVLSTLQVFALLLRPKKDHKYRLHWNIYHHGVGYSVLVLSMINVSKGFNILNPDPKWRHAYIIVIGIVGGIAVLLEAVTWTVVLRRKKSKNQRYDDSFRNGHTGEQPLAP